MCASVPALLSSTQRHGELKGGGGRRRLGGSAAAAAVGAAAARGHARGEVRGGWGGGSEPKRPLHHRRQRRREDHTVHRGRQLQLGRSVPDGVSFGKIAFLIKSLCFYYKNFTATRRTHTPPSSAMAPARSGVAGFYWERVCFLSLAIPIFYTALCKPAFYDYLTYWTLCLHAFYFSLDKSSGGRD